MATIGLVLCDRNRRPHARGLGLQCIVSDGNRRDPAVHVVPWHGPSGSKVFIGISCLMQIDPACTELTQASAAAHCPHRRIFGNRDGGRVGGGSFAKYAANGV